MRFAFYFFDGSRELAEGNSIADAFSRAGYGSGAINALDFYKEIPEGVDDVNDWVYVNGEWVREEEQMIKS